jgi:hypothetical protein
MQSVPCLGQFSPMYTPAGRTLGQIARGLQNELRDKMTQEGLTSNGNLGTPERGIAVDARGVSDDHGGGPGVFARGR